ncbi:MAG: c-type cytochrome [Chloroflexi bacterium]|nr:c-type cytochrome [Chloroflexota bacterium]
MKMSLRRGLIGALAVALVALVVLAACEPPGTTEFPEPACAATGTCPANPCPDTEDVMKDGEQLYLTVCATCHGYAADGFGPQYQLYSPRPASFKAEEFQAQLASDPGAIFLKTWHGNTAISEDDQGDVPHSIPAELGVPHTELKVSSQVREKIRSQCIEGADQPQESGGMTEEELWKVVLFLRTAPSR